MVILGKIGEYMGLCIYPHNLLLLLPLTWFLAITDRKP